MVGKKENIRNYEVSIWTLQDSFITVLKPLNLEHKGAIQDGKITLKDDGENTISFSIPMYIREKGEFIENPLWYNRQEGFLIANLRKLKVIFNKRTEYEEVFEFLITKVTDKHEGFSKMCEIEGEGLAFNELGKQGYKISLSSEDLWNNDTGEIFDNNINYWCDKVFKNSNWHYSIQMDWSSFDGIIFSHSNYRKYEDMPEEEKIIFNNNRGSLRRWDKIYEDAYVASWTIDETTGKLVPGILEKEKEKFRTIDSSESNRYNLIQTIAETFGVFTKFKYYYDDNYHIIDREVIFYNNFLNEAGEVIDLNFNYETQSISRELDANDLVTKMYVKKLDDDSSPSGEVSIMETNANKSGEDYIFNFDYLHETNTISEEQYQAVQEFEDTIGILNKSIFSLQKEIQSFENEKNQLEADRDNASAQMKESQEQLDQIEAREENFKTENGKLTVSDTNPAILVLTKKNNEYSSNFPSKYEGIDSKTIKIYKEFKYNENNTARKVSSELGVNYECIEENGDIRKIKFSSSSELDTIYQNSKNIYATFSYNPLKAYEKSHDTYLALHEQQKNLFEEAQNKIDTIENSLEQKNIEFKNKLEKKEEILADFENLMGSALREGTWQPEDEYIKYGEKHTENIPLNLTNQVIDNSKLLNFIWDTELDRDEEKNYYESGVDLKKVYYPCIDLSNTSLVENLTEKSFIQNLVFSYRENTNLKALRTSQIGGGCRLAFVKNGNTIKPVLLLLNLQDYEKEEGSSGNLDFSKISYAAVSYLSLEELMQANTIEAWESITASYKIFKVNNSQNLGNPALIANPLIYQSVYPRIVINSEYLKMGTNDIVLLLNDTENNIYKCELYEDYYTTSKDGKTYITIKPETLFKAGIIRRKVNGSQVPLHIKINYIISDNALHVYLDAKEVMKENAYPKVSYNINALSINTNLTYNMYNRLGQLAHINDPELKLSNVMGYISAVDLNLDKPWEDSITIQNYKNKFEDLFSSIVAQTEEMKKNAAKIEIAVNGFNTNGQISESSINESKARLNDLIQRNIAVITANANSIAAANKAYLASTDTYRVMNGEVGIAFGNEIIDNLEINQNRGLLIEGTISEDSNGTDVKGFFNVTNGSMGFFKGTYNNPGEAMLFFRNGDLGISGNIYAKHGWFGGEDGWIIGKGEFNFNQASNIKNSSMLINKIKNINSNYNNLTTSKLGGLLFSANGKAIFTAGDNNNSPMIVLSKNGFTSNGSELDNTLLLFDGNSLYINGKINAAEGNIGGWIIGNKYLGNGANQESSTVGMANGKYGNENYQYSFWAGARYGITANSNQKPPFCVTPGGDLYSTKGQIAGWYIQQYYLGNANQENNATVGMDSRNNATYSFWAGERYDNSNGVPKFNVNPEGYLISRLGKIANWNITDFQLDSGSGNTYVALNSGASNVTGGSSYAIWIGNVTATSAPFSITKTGELTATSGKIANWNITKFQLSSGDGNNFVGINSGTKNTTTNSPDYNPYGDYAFWAGAKDPTNTNARPNFSITKTGILYATGATISGALTASTLSTSNRKNSSTGTDGTFIAEDGAIYVGSSNAFTVMKNGVVTAASGSFTGTITARNGVIGAVNGKTITIGGKNSDGQNRAYIYSGVTSASDTGNDGFYLGTDGLTLGKGVFKVDIAGAVTATSGSIADWKIGNGYLGNQDSYGNSTIGLATNQDYSIWVGKKPNDLKNVELSALENIEVEISDSDSETEIGNIINNSSDSSTPFFGVDIDGNLQANKATFSNLSTYGLNVTGSFYVDGQTKNAVLTANKIYLKSITSDTLAVFPSITSVTLSQGIFKVVTEEGGLNLSNEEPSKATFYMKNGTISLKGVVKINGTNTSNYLTSHQSLSNYYTKNEINNTFLKKTDKAAIANLIDRGENKTIRVYASSNDTPPAKAGNETNILWLHFTGYKDFVIGQDSSGNNITDRWAVVECLWKTV